MSKNSAPQSGGRGPRGWRRALQVALVILALVDALFFALLLRPAGERSRAQREAFDLLRRDIETRREALAGLKTVADGIGESRGQEDDFYQKKFLPRATGFSVIMEEVDRLARANTVRKGVVSYVLGEVSGRPDLNQVEITTMVEGDYGHVVRFVNSVERSPLFLIIDNVSVGGAQGAAGQPKLVRLSLRLVTFFRVM